MTKTFKDVAEGWIFCGYRLLLYRYERCAALATSAVEEQTLLRRMEGALLDAMVKEKIAPPDVLTPQINESGRYAGPVIHGRWQVMESFYPRGTYYVVDHFRDDLLVREAGPGSNVRRFSSKDEGEKYISQFTPSETLDIGDATARKSDKQESKTKMARTPTANAAATRAAAKADKKIDEKPAKKAAAGGAKTTPPAPAKETTTRAVKDVSGRGRTMASAFRDHIAAQKKTKLTDEAIHDLVEKEFGKSIAKNAVSHYRADLERRQAAGQ